MGSPGVTGKQEPFLEENPNTGSCSRRQWTRDRQQTQACPWWPAVDRHERAEARAQLLPTLGQDHARSAVHTHTCPPLLPWGAAPQAKVGRVVP